MTILIKKIFLYYLIIEVEIGKVDIVQKDASLIIANERL
jgi:hypothetical protein